MKQHDLIIIGGGPAGIGAALQAGREGRQVLLVEKSTLGGRLGHAFLVKNFPSSGPGGNSGKTVVRCLAEQLGPLNVPVIHKACRAVDLENGLFTAEVNGRRHRSRTVIMACGLEPRELEVKGAGEALEQGRLVHYWDEIPSPLKNRSVAVIGGGEVALDQACSLAFKGARVTVLARGGMVKAYPGLVSAARRLGVRIKFFFVVEKISPKGAELCLSDGEGRIFICGHAVAAIGSESPKTILSGRANKLMNNGLYLAGDLADREHRQAAIAFGSGVKAAMTAEEHLKRMRI